MRTNIEIDDDLMQAAMPCRRVQNQKETVEAGLKMLARNVSTAIAAMRGKLQWEAIDAERNDIDPEVSIDADR